MPASICSLSRLGNLHLSRHKIRKSERENAVRAFPHFRFSARLHCQKQLRTRSEFTGRSPREAPAKRGRSPRISSLHFKKNTLTFHEFYISNISKIQNTLANFTFQTFQKYISNIPKSNTNDLKNSPKIP